MQKLKLLFPLAAACLILQCGPRFAIRPYYADMAYEITSHPDIMEKMKSEIRTFYGAPYKWGGDSPSGTDCSGMIKTIYQNAANISLPHNAEEMFVFGKKIYRRDLQFGDLVFFADSGKISHIGMFVAKNFFLHASSSKGVMLSRLSDRPYKNQFIGAKRLHIY